MNQLHDFLWNIKLDHVSQSKYLLFVVLHYYKCPQCLAPHFQRIVIRK